MKRKFTLLIAALALLTMIVQPGRAWGQTKGEGDTHAFSQDFSQLLNNNASIPSITIAEQEYPVKKVTISYRYNKTITNAVTMEVLVGGTSWGTQYSTGTGQSYTTVDFEGTATTGAITINFTNNTGDGNGHGTFYVNNVILTEGSTGGGSDPEIHFNGQSANIGTSNPVGTEVSTSFMVYQSNLTEDISFDIEGYGSLNPSSVGQGADPTEVTWNYTPTAAGEFNTTITATSGTASATFNIYGEAKAIHTINIATMTNGSVTASPTSGIQGTNIDLTITPDAGYALETLTVVDGDNNELTVTNNRFQMPDSDVTVSATFEESSAVTVVDYLDREFTGIADGATSYSSWTGKTGASGAVYAGNSAGSNNSIQLRTNGSASGIVTTASAGKVTKVEVDWNSNTATGRKINVYGSNNAYTDASKLHNATTAGTLIGTIDFGSTTELAITDEYAYIGIRSTSGALYLNWVKISWSSEEVPAPSFTITNNNELAYDATQGSFNFTVNNPATDGVTTVSEEVEWISDVAISDNSVTFNTTANTGAQRSGIITLTYTYNTTETVTKEVTITQAAAPVVYSTIPELFAAATTTETSVEVTFNDWVVSGVSTNGKNVFVTDNNGNGFVIYYNSDMSNTFAAGQILSGTAVSCTLKKYNGFAELLNVTATDLTITDGGVVTVADVAMANLAGVNTGALLHYDNLTCGIENSKYYLSDGTTTIQVYNSLYGFDPLVDGKTYNITGVYQQYNNTKEILPRSADDIEEVIIITPVITVDPTTADPFSYLEGNGPSDEQWFEISGTNLTSTNVTATVTTGADYFEVSNDDEAFANEVTTNLDEMPLIIIRMKAGLVAGNYEGAVTLTNEGAEPVVITLAGTVLSNATYNVTCAVTPTEAAIMGANPVSAHEGETVTLTYVAETGYSLTSIVITKTEDGSATGIVPTAGANDSYTFTMPAYDVTATATFIESYTGGNFVKYTAELTEGYYVITYTDNALMNVISNNRFSNGEFTATNDMITDPDPSIVWYIKPYGEYWTIYNDAVAKYAAGTSTKNQGALVDDVTDYAEWTATMSEGKFQFENYGRSISGSDSGNKWLRNNGSNGWACYASSTGGALTLYKMTTLIEHTITFNGNGGTYMSEDTYTQKVYEGIETALVANKFEKANSAFVGWSTTIDGDVEYADQALITVTADKELYAKWSTAYTAMVDDQILGGSVLIDDGQQGTDIIEAAEGTEISLIYTAEIGYTFDAWNVYKADDATITVAVENNKFNMPAYDVIISATFVEAITYVMVNTVDEIVPGQHYIIAGKNGNTDNWYAAGKQNTNNRQAVSVTMSNNTITEKEGVYEFVISGDAANFYTIYDESDASTGYLYAPAGTSSNYLRTQTVNTENGQWTISINEETHVATIKANITNDKYIRYNYGSGVFSCYSSTTSQNNVYLFKKANDSTHNFYSNTKLESVTIAATENYIVHNSATLEATQSLTNEGNATNLIILDGGQLITSSDNVNATVHKNITAATSWGTNIEANDGWYTISSPISHELDPDEEITGLITETGDADYDLYGFDEAADLEWKNYKSEEFNIEQGSGYLYSSKLGTSIKYEGEINTASVSRTLTATKSGFNLIGNPFMQSITMANISGATFAGGYVLTNAGSWKTTVDAVIEPCQGFMVQVETETPIAINRVPANLDKSRANRDYIAFTVANNEYEDVTYALFEKTLGLEKINHRNSNIPMVYIPQDGQNYAIATMDDNTQAFNLNFKAMTTGQYTLSFEAKGSYSYLHVYDKLTNEDIDMLLEGEYSFIGSPRDDENRFVVRLSYSAGIDELSANDIFAYQNGDNIIVNGNGTLQVYDVMGRFVRSISINGTESFNASEFNAGVYIFRMVGDNVKTQKIVVR